MSDIHPPDLANLPENGPRPDSSDGLEERGQGAGRLLGEGAEQAMADGDDDDVPQDDPDAEQTPDGSGPPNHQADES